jgi:ribosomal protein S18 acetylase RimI-like enzyme
MERIRLRAAVREDAGAIAAFNEKLAWETEHIRLDGDRVRAGVRALIEDRSKGEYLVAEAEGRLVGQLMTTYEWSDWRNGVFWWIQSVWVEEEWRGRGVITALYREVARRAREAGDVCGLRLYVETANTRAQGVYRKLGMNVAPYAVMETDFVIAR